MKLKKLTLLLVPLAFALGACSDTTAPRLPDDKGDKEPPPNTQVILPLDSTVVF